MEIIGSIASITQLSRYVLSLIATVSGIYKNIQDGPALQHQQARQLDRLFSTVQTLSESPALNSSSIKEHLEAIIVRIHDLRALLERLLAQQADRPIKKYFKALIKENREEHRILEVFIDLEKDKSALLLSMADTNTQLSARICNVLTERLPSTQAAQTQMPLEKKKASGKGKVARELSASSSADTSSIAKIPGSQDPGVVEKYLNANEGQPDAKQENPESEALTAVALAKKNGHTDASDASQKVTGHVYESITFKESADIHAGNIGESKYGAEHSQKHRYKKIEANDGRLVSGDAYAEDLLGKFFRDKK